MFDILIRNATLVDGSGAPPRQADIGVKDGLIAVPDRPGMGGEFIPEAAKRYLAEGDAGFFD